MPVIGLGGIEVGVERVRLDDVRARIPDTGDESRLIDLRPREHQQVAVALQIARPKSWKRSPR